jgi:hypothetical protein
MFEVFSLDQAHVDVESTLDLAEVVDRHHVRIVEPRSCKRLATEPLLEHRIGGQLRRQNLDGDDPLGGCVKRLPDLAHATTAQEFDQFVAAEGRSLHEASRRQQTSFTAITIGRRFATQWVLRGRYRLSTQPVRHLSVHECSGRKRKNLLVRSRNGSCSCPLRATKCEVRPVFLPIM